jgi:hypothetical protein
VLDLRGATFLGPAAARLLLDLCGQAAASGTRLILWRPNGQPLRTLRIVRFDRIVDLRPPSWRPGPGPRRRRPPDLETHDQVQVGREAATRDAFRVHEEPGRDRSREAEGRSRTLSGTA